MVYQIIYPRAGGPFFSRGEIGIRKKIEGNSSHGYDLSMGRGYFSRGDIGYKNGKGVKIFFS